MPRFPHCSTISTTMAEGVAMIARSTTFGTSLMDGYAWTPWTLSRFGFTGYTTPLYPEPMRLRKIRYPAVPGVSLAPMTAMLLGLKYLSNVNPSIQLPSCSLD